MIPAYLVTSLALLAPAAPAPAAPQSSELCPGETFLPAVPGLNPVYTSIGFNGDRFVLGQSGAYEADGGPGGAKVFEIQPSTGQVTVVDEFVVPGIGRGFGREILGAAVASSGAVLVARREPAPSPARLFQLRRSAPGGTLQVSTLEATQAITWVEENRRFDSDGDRAVISTWVQGTAGIFVTLDFFGVNAAGDWFLEDTVRATRTAWVYNVLDVHLQGDQVLLEVGTVNQRAVAFERQSSGQWEKLALPAGLALTSPSEVALSGDLLATTHVTGNSGRVDVYHRLAPGAWTLTTSIPVAATSADLTYPTNLQATDDLLSFAITQFGPQAPWQTRIYRRTGAGGVAYQAQLPGGFLHLGRDYALTFFGAAGIKAVATDDLMGDVRICEERGFVTCVPQRAGDLSYLELGLGVPAPAELVLEGAPAGVPAYVLASLDRVPSAGLLDSLCVGPAATLVRLPAIARTAQDGSASWLINPAQLPLAVGGTVSGIGGQWTFQAVVRTYAGTATSRAITAQL